VVVAHAGGYGRQNRSRAAATQIYAAVTYHFLAEELLPLDLRASAEDLLQHLRMWRQQSEGRFDLDQVVARAEEVVSLAAQFQAGLRAVDGRASNEVARQLNALIMKAEHALVRLNYVQTEPYAHDRAASEPPVPLLEPITQFLATAPGSDADYDLRTLLVRRRNRIQQELAEAGAALREGLAVLRSVGT
jgi:hypothetical protein